MSNPYLSDNGPLVSVVIPAYNAERFIERTLQSVLTQTYPNIEVLVVDDGSQDRTVEIVTTMAQQDNRVTLLRQPNSGVARARNLGIQHSHGDLIAPLDADDIWYPQNLEKQVNCLLQSDQTVGLVYSWSLEIDENDQLSGGFHSSQEQGDVYLPLLHHNFLGHASATLLRRQYLNELGGYDADLKVQQAQGCEDWDLYLRIAERYHFRVVPEFLIGYRQVQNSMSQNYATMARSQKLILTAAQQRYPLTDASIYRWSQGLFDLFLALRSSYSSDVSTTLYWLKRAFQLDPIMVLLHHDLYLILINLLRLVLSRRREEKPASPAPTIFSDEAIRRSIHLRIKLREWLPVTRYNRMRLKGLANRQPAFRSAPVEMGAIAFPQQLEQ